MRRERAQLRLRTLRVHPNGAVGVLEARSVVPSPGRWSVELEGAPDGLSPDGLQVRALTGRVLGLRSERPSVGAPPSLQRLWVDLSVKAAGPVCVLLEGRLGWGSWRCESQCIQKNESLDWSTWAALWLQYPVDPDHAQLELRTRRLPEAGASPAPNGTSVASELGALSATRGRSEPPVPSPAEEGARLLDPEPSDALGAHFILRPKRWLLGPDGRGRARLDTQSTPLPSSCDVVPNRDGRPIPRLRWNGPCPLPNGMPAGPLRIEAFGRSMVRRLSRWPAGALRALELGPDPRVSVRRVLHTQSEGTRREVELELSLRASKPTQVRCLETIPRSVDPQLRVELYGLEPRDTAFDRGLLHFRADLSEGGTERMSTRYAVSCPPEHHAVRVPEGPE
ncbi:MAG: hypothetical protein AAGD10_08175 [Myxococcota bacterium]